MTDEEPEPFRMPADPDAEVEAAEDEPAGDEPAGDEPAVRAESIADLIDEATRTAAEQAEAERSGDAPQDRSADVWGDLAEAPVHDTDAVWRGAEVDAASGVWDLDEDGDAMWGSAGPPAAAEGMLEAGDEPETFSFPATPDTSAPAGLPVQPQDEDDEPEAFSFAIADDEPVRAAQPPDQAVGAAAEADEAEAWTVPSADTADEDDDVDDDVWTFAVATDQDTPLAEAASPRDGAGWHDLEAEQESGWEVSDLAAHAHAGGAEDEPADFTASIQADGYDDEDDDAPWTAPALDDEADLPLDEEEGLLPGEEEGLLPGEEEGLLPGEEEDLPSAEVVAAEVQDALGDLLGNGGQDAVVQTGGPAAPTVAAPDPDDVAGDAGLDDLDDLDDFDDLDDLDDFDHLDDMAAAVPAVGHDQTPSDDAAPDDEEAVAVDQPLDAPTAARQVMEPGSVTFSSSGKKKKRGLFG